MSESTTDALPDTVSELALLACCASPVWVGGLLAGRPYPDRAALLDRVGALIEDLPWSEVTAALAAHPRIGERPTGAGRELEWSRREQNGMAAATEDLTAALAAANAEYERRFGHVYLVRAAGRSAPELLALLRGRLGNDPATERAVVRRELGEIARIRLERLL